MAKSKASADSASLAGSYARWRSSRLGQITDRLEENLLQELVGDADQLDILDVGCGDGTLAIALSHRDANVTGLDPEPRMLQAARTRAMAAAVELTLVRGRGDALPYADNTFDRVVAVATLCFVTDVDRAIAEMIRVLKPGGRLVIGELGRWSPWAALRRVRGWLGASTWKAATFRTARQLRGLLERRGLIIRECRGSIFYPPFDLAASMMSRFDPWLGRRTTLAAAFIALLAIKP